MISKTNAKKDIYCEVVEWFKIIFHKCDRGLLVCERQRYNKCSKTRLSKGKRERRCKESKDKLFCERLKFTLSITEE